MNRNDKIKLLKGIAEGKTRIEDLAPYKVIIHYPDENKYLYNGKAITKEQVDKLNSNRIMVNIIRTIITKPEE